jgi:hypothetical protein
MSGCAPDDSANRFYIGDLMISAEPLYHVWTLIDGNLGEGTLRSMCGLTKRRDEISLYRGMWRKLKRYRGGLCKKCRWEEVQAAAILSDVDRNVTLDEHDFLAAMFDEEDEGLP